VDSGVRLLLRGYRLVSINKAYYPEIGGIEIVAQRIAEFGSRLFDKSVAITFSKQTMPLRRT